MFCVIIVNVFGAKYDFCGNMHKLYDCLKSILRKILIFLQISNQYIFCVYAYTYYHGRKNCWSVSSFARVINIWLLHFRADFATRPCSFGQKNTPTLRRQQPTRRQALMITAKIQSTCMLKFQKTLSNFLFYKDCIN